MPKCYVKVYIERQYVQTILPQVPFKCAVILQMMCLEHSMSLKQTEFETRLRAIEEAHRKSMNKLQEEITGQQRSTNQ